MSGFDLGPILVSYRHDNQLREVKLDGSFNIACVQDSDKVYSSIDKTRWSEKVIQEDFNRLKEEVAADIKSGEKKQALDKIEKYRARIEIQKSDSSLTVQGKFLNNTPDTSPSWLPCSVLPSRKPSPNC